MRLHCTAVGLVVGRTRTGHPQHHRWRRDRGLPRHRLPAPVSSMPSPVRARRIASPPARMSSPPPTEARSGTTWAAPPERTATLHGQLPEPVRLHRGGRGEHPEVVRRRLHLGGRACTIRHRGSLLGVFCASPVNCEAVGVGSKFGGTVETLSAPPSVTTTSLAIGTIGVPYTDTLAAAGGLAPYSWAVDRPDLCRRGCTWRPTARSAAPPRSRACTRSRSRVDRHQLLVGQCGGDDLH